MSTQLPPAGPPVADGESPPRMPGAYNARWDDSSEAGPAFGFPQSQLNPQYIPLPTPSNRHAVKDEPEVIFAGSVARAPRPTGRAEHLIPGMTMGYPDLTRRGVVPQPPVVGRSGHLARPPPSYVPGSFSSPSALSDIIGRTNRYDMTHGVDGGGNPLPSHIREWMQDPDHDPYAALLQGPQLDAQELENLL